MKTIKLLTLLLCASLFTTAQAPELLNYQGVARNASGQPLANQSITLRLVIRHSTATGTQQYRETHNVTTNDYGLYSVAIGDGTPEIGTMSAVTWESGSKFLQVQIDPSGGTSYTNLGTKRILSAPYALSAGNVELVKNSAGYTIQKDVADKITIGSTTGQSVNKLHVTSSTGVTELVDFKATSMGVNDDVLNLEAPASAPTSAQLLEGSYGSNITYKLDVNGTMTTEGEIRREQTGTANMVPIAYGYVTSAGVMSGAKTSNVSCTRLSAGSYEITITGENYLFTNYVPNGSLVDQGYMRFGSGAGKLRVTTYNASGVQADRRFYFTVFKP
jgi:hypothetical protein